MHEHDLDLIAALAERSLEDERGARALIDECEVCRAEYRSQTEVLAWVASAPRVEMTDLEKAALHRDLWTELTQAPTRSAASPWWQRWSYVAAGLFVTVGLATVLNGEFGGGESAAPTLAETAADLADSGAGEEMAPFAADDGDEGGFDRGGATTTAAAEAAPLPFAELADEARASRQADQQTETTGDNETIEECLTGLGLDEHVVVDEIESDQTYLAVMAEPGEADRSVTFVALDSCEIVHVDR
ncbi:MAG TPA: hypothetical protein VLA91_10640 [Acidimicrobiia bacterium]|nr:hypothetical protein [Acidimicrobiia bacterium]